MAFPGLGNMASRRVGLDRGAKSPESVWAGEGGQRTKSTEAVVEVLEVAGGGAEWEEQVTRVCSEEHLRAPWPRKRNCWLRRSSCRERRKKTRIPGS